MNFKSRKKRNAEENPAFEFTDYETMDLRPHAKTIQEKLEKLNNPSEEYNNSNKKRFMDQPVPDNDNKEQYQGDSIDQSSNSMAINNNFFYRRENELEPTNKNTNTRKLAQKDKFSQRSLQHGSRFPIDINHPRSKLYENSRNGLRAHSGFRDAVQEDPDGEFLNNNGDNAGFLKRKIRYDRRRAAEIGHLERRNHQYLSLKEDIQKANRLVETQEDDSPSNEELLEEKDNDRYTFDEKESMLIADCTDNQDCNYHATCLKNADGKRFCKCVSHYKGNGIFCWLI